MGFDDHRLLSRPVELHWAGWRSNTFALQQAGWSISVDEDFCHQSMQLALRNERAGMVGMTSRVGWEHMRYAHEPYGRLPDLPVQLMARRVDVLHYGGGLPDFHAIDAQPMMLTQRRTSLEDFAHFAPAHTRTQQLIVPEETIDDLMSRILEMQQGPRIERIRAEIAEGQRIDFRERQKFHAQIVSLAA